MSDSKVETISRLAQWRVDNFGPCSYKKSDPFKVGLWNWYLSVEKNRSIFVRLFPESSKASKEQPPVASFILRVDAGPGRKPYTAQIHEKVLRTSEDFIWPIEFNFLGRFTVDIEFLDLKVCPVGGGEAASIWPGDRMTQSQAAAQSSLRCLSRMLNESIHADVTISAADGTLKAHKAVLSASSPVFDSMFHHNLKEKESSTIIIEDMSLESCATLLHYLYGTIKHEDFWKHRLALLGAAIKYDIQDLQKSCEESLLEDINSSNVLERLQEAWLYQLNKLKKGCMAYLFDFGKIYDVRDGINHLFRHGDRELMVEIFQEVLTLWKPA